MSFCVTETSVLKIKEIFDMQVFQPSSSKSLVFLKIVAYIVTYIAIELEQKWCRFFSLFVVLDSR